MMTIEAVVCGNCSAVDVFLRKKGSAVGLYCLACGKWYKWLGKKTVEAYRHRGFKVNEENWTPASSTEPLTPTSSPSTTNKSTVNNDLHQFSKPVEPSDTEDDLGEEYILAGVSRNSLKNNTHAEPHVFHKEPEYDEEEQEVGSIEDLAPCHVCVSGVIDPLTSSDDARIIIFEGIMTVNSISKTKAHGFFKIKHCPGCGKKL